MGTGTMGGNEMTDYERFIDRSNLTAFMNEGKGPKDTKFVITLGHYGNHIKDFLNLAYPDRKFEFIGVATF